MSFPSTAEAIARGKREIVADIEGGHVPCHVGSFSELHDYVDANCYGGAFEESAHPVGVSVEEWCDFWNTVQEALDGWIKSGGLADAVGGIDQPVVVGLR